MKKYWMLLLLSGFVLGLIPVSALGLEETWFAPVRGSKKIRPLKVRSFSVRSPAKKRYQKKLKNGAVLDLAKIPGGSFVIRVAATPRRRIGSIVFVLSSVGEVAVANRYPYVFRGIESDSPNTTKAWNPGIGTYELTALPFTRNRGRGNRGRSATVKFEVIDSRNPSPKEDPKSDAGTPTGTGDPDESASVPPPPEPTNPSALSAVWANYGGDKVVQEETRASNGTNVSSSLWDGGSIRTFAARNEVVSFQVLLEAAAKPVSNVSASFFELVGPGGAKIRSVPRIGSEVFDYRDRPIELFYVRYLPIQGLSLLSYDTYDERHIPEKLRRPFSDEGFGSGTWNDRPHHDHHYPEIAVPFELVNYFQVKKGQSQSLWSDVYIPKFTPPGMYYGRFRIYESGKLTHSILVALEVSSITLPDEPESKTMVYLGYGDVNRRYFGENYPDAAKQAQIDLIRNNHFKVAHRHKISLIDANDGATAWAEDAPRPEWVGRLSGSLFTASHGYDGPGVGVGNNVFSIGTYGSWPWRGEGQSAMWDRTNNWESWFVANAPSTERFLYLIDESHNFSQTNSWASWMNSNPGVGRNLRSFATIDYPNAFSNTPELDIAAAWMAVGPKQTWQNAANSLLQSSAKKAYMYNGKRPASGSFATEDDGVALRELPWGQFKEGISRWFFWESTYYNNFQAGAGETNVFESAHTFGGNTHFDNVLGRTGWNYSNGDGVLFYPGTDLLFPNESYGVKGPIVSMRLKHWRRGIQDVDYIALAMKKDPALTLSIIDQMVPLALWDYNVEDPADPTWKRTDISWSTDPEVWEEARKKLQDIILK